MDKSVQNFSDKSNNPIPDVDNNISHCNKRTFKGIGKPLENADDSVKYTFGEFQNWLHIKLYVSLGGILDNFKDRLEHICKELPNGLKCITDLIAEQLGYSEPDRRKLKRAALLHDIGKLGVSNMVLDKPGKLDEDEWRAIRLHPVFSDQILSQVSAFADLSPIARGHHERLDGKGYPDGLSGNEIGMETRIVTTADIFDALTADRPYRAAMPIEKALNIMSGDLGTAIDETCLDGLRPALEKLGRMQAA